MTSKSEDRFPTIPENCYPLCLVCSETIPNGITTRVQRCYFRHPSRDWQDKDIVQVVVACHDQEMTALITHENLVGMSNDAVRAKNFIKLLCDMASFKSGLPEPKDPEQRNRVVKSLKRNDAPWNF